MRRTLEALFRHLFQLLTLLVLLPLIGVAVAYITIPQKYQSTASLWALQRYDAIGGNGAGGSGSNAPETPAVSQANSLNSLLQTRSFALNVVQGIDLAPSLHLSDSVLNDPQQRQNAIVAEISKNAQAIAQGDFLFVIIYSNRDPQVAQQVIQSIITQYKAQTLMFSAGENLLQSYQSELPLAQSAANTAVVAESQYLATHPDLAPSNLSSDPKYAQLDATRVQDQNVVSSIQSSISAAQLSIAAQNGGANTLYSVIDTPQRPIYPQSRLNGEVLGGGEGLGIALLAIILYLVILVRRDRAIYSADDLKEESFGIPVVMQLPQLKPALISLIVTHGTNAQSLARSSKSVANRRATQ